MIKFFQNFNPIVPLIIATTLEVSGDAIIRICIHNHSSIIRISLALVGAILLFGYGLFLNLAPVEFGQVVGIYIATLFVIWQITNFIAFGNIPSTPIIVGGLFVIAGGLIIAFWK